MPPARLSPSLGEHRVRVLEYLRGIVVPRESVTRTIVAAYLMPAPDATLLRPLLVLWAASACGLDDGDAVPVAAAFELFDRFFFLHDALVETPDAAPGSPVARWGLGQTLNAGDTFYALALRSLASDVRVADRRLPAAAVVTNAVLQAVAGGERSGSLASAALQAGAIVAGAAHLRDGFAAAGRALERDPERAVTILAATGVPAERCAQFGELVHDLAVAS